MKRHRISSFALIVGMAAMPTSLHGQGVVEYATAPHPGLWVSTIEQARITIDSVRAANNIPGVSIAVSVDGEVVWSEGFGWANVETQTPVRTTTKFRIGSISKALTAAGLAVLVEEGRLDIDAPIQRYVPSFPEKAKGTITTRLLAGHLAGVRHYAGDEVLNSKRYASVTAGLEIFIDDTLQTPPGAAYSYSSYGWNLISAVMEGASGEDFLPFMRAHLFRALGMRHTVADYTDSIIIGRTGYYGRGDDGAIRNEPFVDNSYKWASGGFLSTPEDLLLFANALVSGDLLSAETLELLWTSQTTTAGDETNYGIGWRTGQVGGMHRLASHGGGSVGGNSWLGILPNDGIALAITSNISGAGWRSMPVDILQAFLETKQHGMN